MDLVQLAHVFGCLMKKDSWYACPLASDPYIIPKSEYDHVVSIQFTIQKLKSLLINKEEFLIELQALNDDFVTSLLACRKLKKIEFGIIRSDYISDGSNLKNVETNCIASSFGYLSSQIAKIHQIVNSESEIVPNKCILPESLNAACDLYNEECTQTSPSVFRLLQHADTVPSSKCILMIVQPNESNISDQIGLSDGLKYPMFRITFDQVFDLKIHNSTLVYGNFKVAVIYYRAGYTPNDYPTNKQFDARRILEHSNAINCPSISLQLMGLKKIQQLTSNKQSLSSFLSPTEVDQLLPSFMGLYTMDQATEQGKLAYDTLITNPDKYVLKPQREGGSNNYYGQDILTHLNTLSKDEYKKYILMEKISSPSQQNTLTRFQNGHYAKLKGSCISEIGIYGYFIMDNGILRENKVSGYLTRTKLIGTNEGGVASGYSYLNALQFGDV